MSKANLSHLSNKALIAMIKKYQRWNKKHVALENRAHQTYYAFAAEEAKRRGLKIK